MSILTNIDMVANLWPKIARTLNIVCECLSQIRLRSNGILVFLVCLGASFVCFSQGVATRGLQPEARKSLSGKPFLASLTDVAADAGLLMTFTSGSEKPKYIVEANGTGAASSTTTMTVGLTSFSSTGRPLKAPP
ncbi:MAG: hypothetical protein WKF37_23305 [Bryobacteraceae bacterium]